MAINIGQPVAHDFRQPLGMLSDCHRRIERFLAVLVAVADIARPELTDPEREALVAALAYFRESGPRHTADEEESLFPRLRSQPSAAEALSALDRLEADHRRAEALHAAVAALADSWLAAGTLPEDGRCQLAVAVAELKQLYAAHIAIEDGQLFPAAGKVLDAPSLTAIGEEMAARRGLRAESRS